MITIPQLPGSAGIVQTVSLMRTYMREDASDPLILQQATQATKFCGRGDTFCQAKAIEDWTRNLIAYIPDPLRTEKLAKPKLLAATIAKQLRGERYRAYGDCDDMTLYAGTLALAIGLRPVLQVVGRGDRFSHVYLRVNGVAVDPSVPMGTPEYRATRRLILTV